MDKEELIKTLRKFTESQLEELGVEGRKVFYAIMSIADERDDLKDRINEAIDYMKGNIRVEATLKQKHLINILKGEKDE